MTFHYFFFLFLTYFRCLPNIRRQLIFVYPLSFGSCHFLTYLPQAFFESLTQPTVLNLIAGCTLGRCLFSWHFENRKCKPNSAGSPVVSFVQLLIYISEFILVWWSMVQNARDRSVGDTYIDYDIGDI